MVIFVVFGTAYEGVDGEGGRAGGGRWLLKTFLLHTMRLAESAIPVRRSTRPIQAQWGGIRVACFWDHAPTWGDEGDIDLLRF